MAKIIAVDYEKCIGCRTCETVCSLKHNGEIAPYQSRIKVVRWDGEGKAIPMNCRQCEWAPCEAICPIKAISRDELMGREVINYDLCIGCLMCVVVCPFGAISFDTSVKKVVKCDLCDDDPLCVKYCMNQALQYIDAKDWSSAKQAEAAEKVTDVMHKIATTVAAGESMPYS